MLVAGYHTQPWTQLRIVSTSESEGKSLPLFYMFVSQYLVSNPSTVTTTRDWESLSMSNVYWNRAWWVTWKIRWFLYCVSKSWTDYSIKKDPRCHLLWCCHGDDLNNVHQEYSFWRRHVICPKGLIFLYTLDIHCLYELKLSFTVQITLLIDLVVLLSRRKSLFLSSCSWSVKFCIW